jgi:hypothetical protein
MDEENLFLSEVDYGLTEKTTNLTGENIAAERIFKMKVLEWLTNGEPKVFRSPAEGNYVVRLMNSSLAPNDTVGRMLHTFTSTAYEVADFNYTTLGELGFIKTNIERVSSTQWQTIDFRNALTDVELLNPGHVATTVRFNDMKPGEMIQVKFKDSGVYQLITIGVTGSYYIDTGVEISSIRLATISNGSMTYSYLYTQVPSFETIYEVETIEIPGQQFIGE